MHNNTLMKADPSSAHEMGLTAIVGQRVRQARTTLDWTLDELADRSQVSRRTVVNVEKGSANASIEILLRLATALGLSLASLVADVENSELIVRKRDNHRTFWRGANGGEAVMVVSTNPPEVVEMWDWTLGPGDTYASSGHTSGTKELIHVVIGELTLTVGQRSVRLNVGDAVWFDGSDGHIYANSSNKKSRFTLTVFEPEVKL